MSRRTWTAQDPEPDDHPDLGDNLGEVWCWEDDTENYRCACGLHACMGIGEVGWWSPTMQDGDLAPWSSIFTRVHPSGQRATKVHELTAEESSELCREMFS